MHSRISSDFWQFIAEENHAFSPIYAYLLKKVLHSLLQLIFRIRTRDVDTFLSQCTK